MNNSRNVLCMLEDSLWNASRQHNTTRQIRQNAIKSLLRYAKNIKKNFSPAPIVWRRKSDDAEQFWLFLMNQVQ